MARSFHPKTRYLEIFSLWSCATHDEVSAQEFHIFTNLLPSIDCVDTFLIKITLKNSIPEFPIVKEFNNFLMLKTSSDRSKCSCFASQATCHNL